MKTCYTKKVPLGVTIMNLLRKTILILVLLTPLVLYATSEKNAEVDEEVGVRQPFHVEIYHENELNGEVSQLQFDYSITDLKLYASKLVTEKWNSEEINAFEQIIYKESSWRVNEGHYSDNKSSATGLAGFLDMTWSTVGCSKTYDEYYQLECAIRYISNRYGTPTKAIAFHQINGWY